MSVCVSVCVCVCLCACACGLSMALPAAGSSMINMCPHPRHRSLEPESSPAAQPHAHVHIIPGMPMGMMPPAAGAAFGGVPMPGQHNAGVQGQGGSAPGQPNVHHVFFRRGPDGNMEPVPGAAGVGGAAPAGTAAGVAGAAAMMQHIAAAAAAHASATAPGGQNPAQRQQAGSRSATNPSTGQPQPSSSSSSSNQHGRVQVPAALIHGLYQEASNPREGWLSVSLSLLSLIFFPRSSTHTATATILFFCPGCVHRRVDFDFSLMYYNTMCTLQ